jgi:hypothetical protein
MLNGLKQFVARFVPKKFEPELVLEGHGFELVLKGERLWQVRWADVQEIFAFKQDCWIYDNICLGFRVSEDGSYYWVNEDTPGYAALLQELSRVHPDHDKD